ncbi:hypothetical protein CL642_01225 [bacterium]|jgi:hypothetical protein|nr:hypothetical protein [bacterium]|tara:strand:- start:13771 stop:13959 length:189 start_codon:yes stop_codon:yes gene_type:complete
MMTISIIEKNEKFEISWTDERTVPPSIVRATYNTYDEVSHKALQLIAAANPNQTNLTDFGGN